MAPLFLLDRSEAGDGQGRPALPANGFSRSVALLVGIDSYRHGIPCLQTARNDARELGELLAAEHGYTVLSLLDASRDQVVQALEDLPSLVDADGRVLFYFAGHGVAFDDVRGPQGYVVLEDSDPASVDSYLSMADIHRALTSLPCRHLLAILDCCFAGAFRWSMTRTVLPLPKVVHDALFERYVRSPAWQVLTSAAHNQQALDVIGGQALGRRETEGSHSPFAQTLLDGLRGEADLVPAGGDGLITASELYLFLRHEVEIASFGAAKQQTPGLWHLARHDMGEYVFTVPHRSLDLPPAPSLTAASNPYRGLEPFDQEHQDLFFGREETAGRLAELVEERSLVVLLGPSGSGKSSLARAGLIPRLSRAPGTAWAVAPVVRPLADPWRSLAAALEAPPDETDETARALAESGSGAAALVEILEARRRGEGKDRILLVVDQLEELVTLGTATGDRVAFERLLVEALAAGGGRVRVLLTVRSEFEPYFARGPLAALWHRGRFLLPPMEQDDLRRAILGPAAERVFQLRPPELVDTLINEVVLMPGALPLLSFTLSELYRAYVHSKRTDRTLTGEDYERIGGVAGALRWRAESELARLGELGPEAQDTLKAVMLRMVSQEGGEIARRRVLLEELEHRGEEESRRAGKVRQRFEEARLLVSGLDPSGKGYVEPAHDALVRAWDRLTLWISEAGDALALHRRVTRAATDWRDGERSSSLLWHRDPRLSQALHLRPSPQGLLNDLEATFLEKSRRARTLSWILRAALVLAIVGGVVIGATVFTRARAREGQLRLGLLTDGLAERSRAALERNDSEEALFLATQAYLLHHRYGSGTLAEIDKALRAPLVRQDFGYVLERWEGRKAEAVAFSPDEQWLATTNGIEIHLWRLATPSARPRVIQAGPALLTSLRFSPGGLLAAGALDDRIRIWNPAAPEAAPRELTVEAVSTEVVGFRGESEAVLVCWNGERSRIELLPLAAGRARTLPLEPGGSSLDAVAVAVSPDGRHMAGASLAGTVRLWTAGPEGWTSRVLFRDAKAGFSAVGFSADGEQLAAGTFDDRLLLWSVRHPEVPVADVVDGQGGDPVAFQPRSSLLATGTSEGSIVFRRVPQVSVAKTLQGHTRSLSTLAFSPSGRWAASGDQEGIVRLWPLDRSADGRVLKAERNILSLAFDPRDPTRLVTGEEGDVESWSLPRGTRSTLRNPGGRFQSLAFSRDGRRLAAAGLAYAWLWAPPRPGIPPRQLSVEAGWTAVAFQPDGRRIAAGKSDGRIRLFDADRPETGAVDLPARPAVESRPAYVSALAFSPDGQTLASADSSGAVLLWNLGGAGTPSHPVELPGPQTSATSLAFDPTGTFLAVGSGDYFSGFLHVWRLGQPQEPPLVLPGFERLVRSVAFSPDGKRLAAGSEDGTVRIWSMDRLEAPPVVLTHHKGSGVWGLAFSPDGRILASGSLDTTVRLWTARTDLLVAEACQRLRRNQTPAEWRAEAGALAPYEKACPNRP